MRSTHDASVAAASVHEQLIEFYVLLGEGVIQVVQLQVGKCQNRRSIKLRIIKPVEEVNSTRTRRGEADTQPAGELGVSAGHERGGFFMANLDEAYIVLALPQRLHNPIDPVARNSKYRVHTPIEEAINKNISGGSCHEL